MSQTATAAPAQRPWVTAGVALTTAGLVVATPVAVPNLPEVNVPDIQLTAGLLEDTAQSITDLVKTFTEAPFPLLQQVFDNQMDGLATVLADPSKIGDVLGGGWENFGTALGAPFTVDPLWDWEPFVTHVPAIPCIFPGFPPGCPIDAFDLIQGWPAGHEVPGLGLLGNNGWEFEGLQTLFGGDESVASLLNFTASPFTGVLLGLIGPLLGPLVALSDDFSAIFDGTATDPLAALINIPGHMLDAFLNGGETLDALGLIEPLLSQITGGATLPANFEAGIALGGLLSGPGSLFGSLETTNIGFGPIGLDGTGAGPIGSLLAIPYVMAASLGWDGDGNPFSGDGLLTTITDSLGLDFLTNALNDVEHFLTTDILDPMVGMLSPLLPELAAGFIDLFGSDLGVVEYGDMLLDTPEVLLSMVF